MSDCCDQYLVIWLCPFRTPYKFEQFLTVTDIEKQSINHDCSVPLILHNALSTCCQKVAEKKPLPVSGTTKDGNED